MKNTVISSRLQAIQLFLMLFAMASCTAQSKKQERIYFDSEAKNKSYPTFEIFSMNPDGSNWKQHTFDAVLRRANTSPKFSPDGKKVIFGTYKYGGYKIAIANSDFTNQEKFSKGPHYSYVGSWSPDGTKVLYNKVDTEKGPYFQGDFEIFMMDFNTGSDTNVSRTKGADSGPTWSPDGLKILFGSDRSGNSDIYTMNERGQAVINLTNTPNQDEFGFSWSPDGSKIAFYVLERKSNKKYIDLYIMNSDGTGRKNLTNNQSAKRNLFVPYYEGAPPIFYGTSWSPDGERIAFSSKRNSKKFQIFTIHQNGGNLKQLTNNEANNVFPNWHLEQ